MSPRHVALVVLGAAVLLAGVYLFHEVHTTPAAAGATQRPTQTSVADRVDDPDHEAGQDGKSGKPPAGSARGARPGTSSPSTNTQAPSVASDDNSDDERANPSIEAVMDRANKAYDHSDFEEAKMIAGKVLSKLPTNIRMMRIMVSASCIDNDIAVAQKWFEQLPKPDREQMKLRCDKYGVSFKEPPQ